MLVCRSKTKDLGFTDCSATSKLEQNQEHQQNNYNFKKKKPSYAGSGGVWSEEPATIFTNSFLDDERWQIGRGLAGNW